MKLVQSKTKIRKDIKYIRYQLAYAERMMRNSDVDWEDLKYRFMEVSGIAGNLEGYFNDNATGIEDSYYK